MLSERRIKTRYKSIIEHIKWNYLFDFLIIGKPMEIDHKHRPSKSGWTTLGFSSERLYSDGLPSFAASQSSFNLCMSDHMDI